MRPRDEGGYRTGWTVAAFSFCAALLCTFALGYNPLASAWMLGVLLASSVAIGGVVTCMFERSHAKRIAKADAAKREARNDETERRIHRARILGKFDGFGK